MKPLSGPAPNAHTRVLIVSDDPSGGHRAAARAVNEALQQLPDADSKILEFQDLCSKPRRWFRSRQQDFINQHKGIARAFHRQWREPSEWLKTMWKGITWVNHCSVTVAQAMVKKEDPDVLLSVHMGTNAMSRLWEKHGALKAPAHCVVTDFLAIGVWQSENIKRYYVASEAVKKDLEGYGVPTDRIMVTGLPVSPRIASPDNRPRDEVKKALGLDPQQPVILLMGGSKGDQRYIEILKALDARGNKAQVVAVCGRNKTRLLEVEEFAGSVSFPVHPRPFVDMRDYYHAADVVITKPGGLTSAEVLAKGKAMVVVSPYPGMEEEQVERLTQAGVARYGDCPENAASAALELLHDPSQKARLEANAKAFGRPDAAVTIARDLLASRRQTAQAS